jgi:hypothetical protein
LPDLLWHRTHGNPWQPIKLCVQPGSRASVEELPIRAWEGPSGPSGPIGGPMSPMDPIAPCGDPRVPSPRSIGLRHFLLRLSPGPISQLPGGRCDHRSKSLDTLEFKSSKCGKEIENCFFSCSMCFYLKIMKM